MLDFGEGINLLCMFNKQMEKLNNIYIYGAQVCDRRLMLYMFNIKQFKRNKICPQ